MVSPVECHVASVFEYVVVRVAHNANVAIAWLSLLDEAVESILGVSRVAGKRGRNFLIDNDVDLDAAFGSALQDFVETPFLVEVWRASQEKLGADPPVGQVDRLLGALESD